MKNLESSHPDFPSVNLRDAERELCAEFASLRTGYDSRKAKRIEAWKRYNFQPYGNERKGASSIVDSTIFNAVEWMAPSLIQPFIETSDYIKVVPESAEIRDLLAAEYNRELLNYQLRKRLDMYSIYYDTFKTFLVCGDSYLKVTWQDKDLDAGEPVGRPVVTCITPDAIHYDWTVKGGFMKSKVVTHEEDWSRADVMGMLGKKGVIDSRIKMAIEGDGMSLPTSRLRDEQVADKAFIGEKFEIAEKAKKLFLRREQWTEYDLHGDGKLVPVMAVFIDGVLVQLIKNPYPFQRPPFVQAECVRDPFGNPALGLSEVLSDIQEYRTAILRMTSDNLNSQLNGMYEMDQTYIDNIGFQLIMNTPPGVKVGIPSRRSGSINPLPVAPLAPQTMQIWEMLDVAGENRGGFTRYSQGLDSKALNQTATGFVGITQRSEMRLWEIATRFAESCLKPMTRMIIALNQKLLTPQDIEVQFGINGRDQALVDVNTGEVVDLTKEPGDLIQVSKEDISGNFSVNLDLQVGSDKQQKINNLFQFGQYFAPYMGQGIPPEVIGAIAVESARLMNLPKIENIVRSNYAGRGISVPALGGTGQAGAAGGGVQGSQTESVLSESLPSQLPGQPPQ